MAKTSQPGSGDPYWYEWFVGLSHVIDLLLPDSGVESVTFQEADLSPIDDVVVRFSDGRAPRCYQVKHKKAGGSGSGSFTFGDLVGERQGHILVADLARGWMAFHEKSGIYPEVILYSNRRTSNSARTVSYENMKYKQRPIPEFLQGIKEGADEDDDLRIQWKQFVKAAGFENQDDALLFARYLKVEFDAPGLRDAENELVERLSEEVCGGRDDLAEKVFQCLCGDLRKWTTIAYGQNVVTRAVALRSVARINEDQALLRPPIDVAVPAPVFPSRAKLARDLARRIVECDEPVIFISGSAGSGKSRLASLVCEALTPSPMRFYAFQPLDVDDFSYSPDHGVVSARDLWATLLHQLRELFDDPYSECPIPVIDELCQDCDLRAEVMRLASALARQRQTSTILMVDGIDHAARANVSLTFLEDLPSPESMPPGVKLVLLGQPYSGYPKYPLWLDGTVDKVLHIDLPRIGPADIACLIRDKTPFCDPDAEVLAQEIAGLSGGNTLSVVYAVHLISASEDVEGAIAELRASGISSNVGEYYRAIWKRAEESLRQRRRTQHDVPRILACVMHVYDGLLLPDALVGAFGDLYTEKYQVEEDLALLAPLLRRGSDGGYRPLHNDFRLFVDGLATSNDSKPCMSFVANRLSTYVLGNPDSMTRTCFGVRILAAAGRTDACLQLSDASFILEAVTSGVPWALLCEQVETVYKMACESHDLLKLQRVHTAISTLAQVNAHLDYYDEDGPVLHADCLVPFDLMVQPLDRAHLRSYRAMLNRVIWLLDNASDKDDGRRLFEAWLRDRTPEKFLLAAFGQDGPSGDYENEAKAVMHYWGRVAARLNLDYEELDPGHQGGAFSNLLVELRDGFAAEALVIAETDEAAFDAIHRMGISYESLGDLFTGYLSGAIAIPQARIDRIACSVADDGSGEQWLVSLCRAIALADGIGLGDIKLPSGALLEERAHYLTDEGCTRIVIEGFLYGFSHTASTFEDTVADGEKALGWFGPSQREHDPLMVRVRAALCLGYSMGHGGRIAGGTPEAQCIESYLAYGNALAYDFYKADLFLQYVIFAPQCGRNVARELGPRVIRDFVLSRTSSYVRLRAAGWLADTGAYDEVEEFVQNVCGEDGRKLLASYDGNDVYRSLRGQLSSVDARLANQYDDLLARSVVGFVDHEDYSLHHLVELFKIMTRHGSADVEEARRLFTLNAAADFTGGNSAMPKAEEALLDWASGAGVRECALVRAWSDSLRYDYGNLWKQFTMLLPMATDAEEVLACFAIAYGTSSYYDVDELGQIAEAANLCVERARELGCIDQVRGELDLITSKLLAAYEGAETTQQRLASSDKLTEARASLRPLSLDEIWRIACDDPVDRWDWLLPRAACDELVGRSVAPSGVYSSIARRRTYELGETGWERWSGDVIDIIEHIAEFADDEAFFGMLAAKSDGLSNYGFGTANTDVAYAIRLRLDRRCPEKTSEVFAIEYACKEVWATAGEALSLDEYIPADPEDTPSDLVSLCVDTLADQLVEEDSHRCEDAARALSWLGLHVPRARARLYAGASSLAPRCRALAFKIAERWMTLGCDDAEEAMASWLEETRRLDEAVFLSIALDIFSPRLGDIRKLSSGGETASRQRKIPDLRYIRRGDVACEADDGEDISLRDLYLCSASDGSGYLSCRDYRIFESHAMDPSDAWVISQLPEFSETDDGEMLKLIDALEEGTEGDEIEQLAISLMRRGIDDTTSMLGASLYVPYGDDELTVQYGFRATKVWFSEDEERVDREVGCQGILSRAGGGDVHYYSEHGFSLCTMIGGHIWMRYGDCGITPTQCLRPIHIHPSAVNPMSWVDEADHEVLKFERLLFPIRRKNDWAPYYRQPQVWRWVGDVNRIIELLEERNFKVRVVLTSNRHEDQMIEKYNQSLADRAKSPFPARP